MESNFAQYWPSIEMYLLCLILPGIVFIISGIRTIRKKSTVILGLKGDFHWKKPTVLKGKEAEKEGGCSVALGIFLLIFGGLMILGIFQYIRF